MSRKKDIPFPTKDDILNFLRQKPGKISKREIARAFHIRGDDRLRLKKLLKAMTEEGLLDRGHKKQVHLGGELPPVTVIEITGVDNMGDLAARPTSWDGEAPPPPITLFARDKKATLGIGDRALVRLSRPREARDGYVASIIRKLESSRDLVMGFFRHMDDAIAMVHPTDKKNRDLYVVGKEDWNGAEDGELVLVEIQRAGRRRSGPRPARVKQCLGTMDEPRSISLIAIHAHGIPLDFSDAVLAEADRSEPPVLGERTDLRHIPLITIDPQDARDHDDAIWAEPDPDPQNDGGWHIIVAIADVSHYVRPGSTLDREARTRGNSVYFPDRVVPMLPERLSNGLCSLQEGEDRYCFAVHLWFNRHGKKLRHKFVRGLMRSAGGLAYQEVQKAMDGEAGDRAAPLLDQVIRPLFGAFDCMMIGRNKREPLELEVPERKITLDDEGHVRSIQPRVSLPVHKLVEEYMIQANVAAAQELSMKGWPCMYRVHEPPSLEKLEALRDFLKSLSLELARGQVMLPKIFNNILRQVKDGPHDEVVNTMVLRSQSQAVYSPENLGHFGLSLSQYAHFTSPIRRYADILVHRALTGALKLGEDGLSKQDRTDFPDTAQHISDTERRAMLAERESTDRYVAAYMAAHVGDIFQGKISGVSRAGLFVTLDDSGGDGIVPISSLVGDYFIYDRDLHLLEGEYTNIVYQLGDRVTVRLREANPVTGGLMLELLDDDLLKARGRGKAPKKVKKYGAAKPRGGRQRDRSRK